MEVKVNEKMKTVIVPDTVGVEQLAQIIEKYSDEYKIYIGDEFDEDTDIDW